MVGNPNPFRYQHFYFIGWVYLGKGYPNILKKKSKCSSCPSFYPSYFL